jgi:hypothetical protein
MYVLGLAALVAIGFFLMRDRIFRAPVAVTPDVVAPTAPATTGAKAVPAPSPLPTPVVTPTVAPAATPTAAPSPGPTTPTPTPALTQLATTTTAPTTTRTVATSAPAPDARGTLTQQAQRYLERGNVTRAIDAARRAATADPSDAEAWLTLGAAYDASGNRTQARSAYQNCVDRGHGGRVTECRALLGQ